MSTTLLVTHLSDQPPVDTSLTVADAVWVAMAALQERAGPSATFDTKTIADYVRDNALTRGAYKSVWQHVNQHCVANRKAQPNRLCYLFATGGANRRLWRTGDSRDPSRRGAATHPAWEKLPSKYYFLRRWYEEEWCGRESESQSDLLLDLIGSGTHIWADEPADQYIANLRGNWDSAG